MVYTHEMRLFRPFDGHGDLRVTAGGIRIGEPHLVTSGLEDLEFPPHGLRPLAGAVVVDVVGPDEVGLKGAGPPDTLDNCLRFVHYKAGKLVRINTDVSRVSWWRDG